MFLMGTHQNLDEKYVNDSFAFVLIKFSHELFRRSILVCKEISMCYI